MPTMLNAVVKESSQGTVLSVKFISIQTMPKRAIMNTAVNGGRYFNGIRVIGTSVFDILVSV